MTRVGLLVGLVLACVVGQVEAATYYFSTSVAGSADTNPCSEAQPCRTTVKAETLSLNPGDSLLFKRGDTFTANTQFDIVWSGSSGSPITIGAYGTGDRPILSSGLPTTSNATGIRLDARTWIVLENLRITAWLKGIQINGGNNVLLDSLEVDTIRGECLRFFNAAHTLTLEDSLIHDCGTTQNGEGIYIGTDTSADGGIADIVRDSIVQRNEIYNLHDDGIEMKPGTRNIAVLNNVLHHILRDGFGGPILANSTHDAGGGVNPNHLIQGNLVADTTGTGGKGIQCRTGCRIFQNIVMHNSQAGIYVDTSDNVGDPFPVLVYNNTLVSNAGAALQQVGNVTVTSVNNLAWLNGSGNTATNPLFANLAARDYRLCSAVNQPVIGCPGPSPAIDAGTNVGLGFTGVAPDLGALEVVPSTLPDLTTTLVVHLPLNDGSGSSAVDAAGGDNPGTLSGTPTWVAGTIGSGALQCDGVNDQVTVAGDELGQPSAVTLAAWVKLTGAIVGDQEVLTLANSVSLRLLSSGSVRGSYHSAGGGLHTTFGVTHDTAWHHLVYTATAGSQVLYRNGVAVASSSNAAAISYAVVETDTKVCVGAPGNVRFLAGSVDEVRVYSRVLSALDVAGLYAYRATPPTLSITQPTSSPTYSTDVATLVGVAGSASDEVAVTGVGWTCPQCSPTSGLASGLTSWVLPTLTLASGPNVLTVTATDDAGQTTTDSLTVTLGAVEVPTGLRIVPAFTMGGAGR